MAPKKQILRFLITAGPTREYLDPVRFLTNASSGKMGYACATAALRRGHKVKLISGPVHLNPPKRAEIIEVVSSRQMARATLDSFQQADCVIMTAAVCDYRPKKRQPKKITKTPGDLVLRLERTADILASLGRSKTTRVLIGFAVQDEAPLRNARRKMSAKNLDAIVLNSPKAFAADRLDAEIITADGQRQPFNHVLKSSLASAIVKTAEQLLTIRRAGR